MAVKKSAFLFLLGAALVLPFTFTACTDYEDEFEENYGDLADGEDVSDSSDVDTDSLSSSSKGKVTESSSSSQKSASSSSEKSDDAKSSGKEEKSSSSKAKATSVYNAAEGTVKDLRDGKVYKVVGIGKQLWMAENLAYELKNSECAGGKDGCDTYGRAYDWNDAMDACPQDWHLPNRVEWNTLLNTVGTSYNRKLKAKTVWSSKVAGTDDYGFAAIPAGRFDLPGNKYEDVGVEARFWSSTVSESDGKKSAYVQGFFKDDDVVGLSPESVGTSLLTVRCIYDSAYVAPSSVAESSSTEPESCSSKTYVDSSYYDAKANTLTDFRNERTYKTVTVGIAEYTRTWMAENLNLAEFVTEDSTYVLESMCFARDSSNCKWGRLYTYSAALDSVALFSEMCKGCGYQISHSNYGSALPRGICPAGWHVPDSTEWELLFKSVSPLGTPGKVLRAKTEWSAPGTDDIGFAIYPRGNEFITSSEDGPAYFYDAEFLNDRSYGARVYVGKKMNTTYSLRCVKNDTEQRPDTTDFKDYKYKVGDDVSIYNEKLKQVKDWRDGNVYKTTVINNRLWMAENLNFSYGPKTASVDSSSWCLRNSKAVCDSVGRLYMWSAAIDSIGKYSTQMKGCGYGVDCSKKYSEDSGVRGICPKGWHLPSNNEWMAMYKSVGLNATVLKATTGWHEGEYGVGTDDYGFSVYASDISVSTMGGYDAVYWTCSDMESKHAIYWAFRAGYQNIFINNGEFTSAAGYVWDLDKHEGLSIRCMYDKEMTQE